jgi:PIN domain nuclease of toxin-antitoxin system
MRLRLDTHVIVWAASSVDAFEPPVAALLTDTRHELWMSAVSAWALGMLADRGGSRRRLLFSSASSFSRHRLVSAARIGTGSPSRH